MNKILVTGSKGQLGQCISELSIKFRDYDFHFIDIDELDICDFKAVDEFMASLKPTFCINTAAYTNVDMAETKKESAFKVNALGPKNLAESCAKNNTVLIHISTDFVFDGKNNQPYTEEECPNPLSIYGKTKLEGEINIQENWSKHIIIRTSWLYSLYGKNFLKTMLRLANEREKLNVVDDQIGSPTNAMDLAEVILIIISKHILCKRKKQKVNFYGIYHFSNEGSCSWFDFAKKIFEISNLNIVMSPIPTKSYPTPAIRPKYSVLDTSKIKSVFNININDWEWSLKNILTNK